MFDFPNAPTVGQIITGPNNVQFQWDGVKWITVVPQVGGPFLPLTGGVLSGPGNLSVAGALTAVTPAPGDNSTEVATTAFVHAAVGAGGGGASITISDTAPASPIAGNLWFDSIGLQTYIWYTDPTSSQWTSVINQGKFLTEAPSDGTTYGRMNGAWSAAATPASVNATLAPVLQAAYGDTGRNYIHNPIFNIQQRGGGPFTTQTFGADRWYLFFGSTGGSCSVTFPPTSLPTTLGDEALLNCLDWQNTAGTGANDYSMTAQAIENVRRLSNKTVTLSFMAWAGSGTPKLGIEFEQAFGTGGSPSSPVSGIGSQAFTLSTTPTRYSATVTLPSVAGKTFGSNGDHYTHCNFWFSSGSGYAARASNIGFQSNTFFLTGVQLEVGSYATPLALREPGQELQLCQRFYQVYSPPLLRGACTGGSQTCSRLGMMLPVQMRATPTYTLVSPLPVYNGTTPTTFTPTNSYLSPNFIEFDGTAAVAWGGTGYQPCLVYGGAGGGMTLSADLT